MAGNNKFMALLSMVGALWYTSLVIFIISVTDYPGSDLFRDYRLIIGMAFLFLTGCFRQCYVIWKKGKPVNDE